MTSACCLSILLCSCLCPGVGDLLHILLFEITIRLYGHSAIELVCALLFWWGLLDPLPARRSFWLLLKIPRVHILHLGRLGSYRGFCAYRCWEEPQINRTIDGSLISFWELTCSPLSLVRKYRQALHRVPWLQLILMDLRREAGCKVFTGLPGWQLELGRLCSLV
jgi:hypothetical protein